MLNAYKLSNSLKYILAKTLTDPKYVLLKNVLLPVNISVVFYETQTFPRHFSCTFCKISIFAVMLF